jgi:hypothetical protein
MHNPAPSQVFSVADRGTYRWIWAGEPCPNDRPPKLWLSARFAGAEAALSPGVRSVFGSGRDAEFAWAFAVAVAEDRAPDGREHVFTHLMFMRTPYPPELLEYSLRKYYDGAHGLTDFLQAIFRGGSVDNHLAESAEVAGDLVPPCPEVSAGPGSMPGSGRGEQCTRAPVGQVAADTTSSPQRMPPAKGHPQSLPIVLSFALTLAAAAVGAGLQQWTWGRLGWRSASDAEMARGREACTSTAIAPPNCLSADSREGVFTTCATGKEHVQWLNICRRVTRSASRR